MFNNSFNHSTHCLNNCSNADKEFSDGNANTSEEKTDIDDIKSLDNQDWESKYDVTLSILKEEYLQCLQRIRNVDEKANKYFLVISILMAGLFVVLSGSTIDSLEFNYLDSIYAFLFTLLFIFTFIISLYFGILIFRALLCCFKLVETRKIPDLNKLLIKSEGESSLQYKDALITCYQESINAMDGTVTSKQSYIIKVSEKIELFTAFLFSSLIILIILKLIGLPND